ncbi:MAG: hypothetical protein GY751_13435 [Bacteroidetes bacterium]|nr:hypothetical protein [Bacteroidota bacterium]
MRREKLAKGSHLMPALIAAKLSENVFGEVTCANVASYMRIRNQKEYNPGS